MIEMPILVAEKQALNTTGIPPKKSVSDSSSGNNTFSKRLQNHQREITEGNKKVTAEAAVYLMQEIEPGIYIQESGNNCLDQSLLPQMETASELEFENVVNMAQELKSESSAGFNQVKGLNSETGVELEVVRGLNSGIKAGLIESTAGITADPIPQVKTSTADDKALINEGQQDSEEIIKVELQKHSAGMVIADTQNLEIEEQIDLQQVVDNPDEVNDNEKLTALKKMVQRSGEVGEINEEKLKITIGKDDAQKIKSEANDVKKLMDFESNRINASKLSAADETGKQEFDSESQTTMDKPHFIEIRMENKELNFQNQLQNSVDTKEIIEQVVEKVVIIQEKKVSEIKLDLKPEFLGKMTVQLVMEEGGLTAKFVTDNLQTKQLLENNLNSLRQTLENHGIKVEKAEVNVQLNNGGMFDGSEGNQQERSQNQVYEPYRSQYLDEITVEDEQISSMELSLPSYEGIELVNESSMNFLV